MEGRSLYAKGTHCPDQIIFANRTSIGVCYILNSMTTSPSNAQYNSLISLCAYLCKKYNISPNNIVGHKDYYDTDCLGTILYNRLSDIK